MPTFDLIVVGAGCNGLCNCIPRGSPGGFCYWNSIKRDMLGEVRADHHASSGWRMRASEKHRDQAVLVLH